MSAQVEIYEPDANYSVEVTEAGETVEVAVLATVEAIVEVFVDEEVEVEVLENVIIGSGSGGEANLGFEYTPPTAAALYSIVVPDEFGRRPNVAVYNTDGERIYTGITATSQLVTVTFFEPTMCSIVLT